MDIPNNYEDNAISAAHNDMIRQIKSYGISDHNILDAMKRIPRHHFIPNPGEDPQNAYGDHPVTIGHSQTISQPYIVAYMTELLELKEGERVLEIGTGCGYQTAVLAALGTVVYSVEIVTELAKFAEEVLQKEGINNVFLKEGDGYEGWNENSPYQAIIVTCAPEFIPRTLINQLDEEGRLLLPLGKEEQRLVLVSKHGKKIVEQEKLPVRFVPMVHGIRNRR